jgi:hypothetical protein
MGRYVTESKRAADRSATLTGDLALFGLPNLLQNLADAGLTGMIKIIDTDGTETATIGLDGGGMVSAGVGNLTDKTAVYQMLERPMEGRFVFVTAAEGDEEEANTESSHSVMGLLMEGMRRYDEFHRALALVPDDARFKTTGKKPTDVKEDADPALAKEVWGKAARGVAAGVAEPELSVDSYSVRRLYEHWVTEGSLVRVEDNS